MGLPVSPQLYFVSFVPLACLVCLMPLVPLAPLVARAPLVSPVPLRGAPKLPLGGSRTCIPHIPCIPYTPVFRLGLLSEWCACCLIRLGSTHTRWKFLTACRITHCLGTGASPDVQP